VALLLQCLHLLLKQAIDNRLFYTATINIMANVGLSLGFLIGGRALASLIVLRGSL
jgi:hypothetical protein